MSVCSTHTTGGKAPTPWALPHHSNNQLFRLPGNTKGSVICHLHLVLPAGVTLSHEGEETILYPRSAQHNFMRAFLTPGSFVAEFVGNVIVAFAVLTEDMRPFCFAQPRNILWKRYRDAMHYRPTADYAYFAGLVPLDTDTATANCGVANVTLAGGIQSQAFASFRRKA